MSDRDLISAYLDGVGELTAEERKRVEAQLRDEPDAATEAETTRGVLAQLRALPHEGHEPDWSALEREIRIAVGPHAPSRRPWLRWLIPVGALAVGAALVLLIVHTEHAPLPVAVGTKPLVVEPATAPAEAIYLDGNAVEIGDVDPGALIEDDGSGEALADDSGLLPAQNLDWIDSLDEHALDRAEAWLDHKKGHKG